MFGPTRGFSGMADSMEPCKMLWATLVAMATKCGLGAEIESPTAGLVLTCFVNILFVDRPGVEPKFPQLHDQLSDHYAPNRNSR